MNEHLAFLDNYQRFDGLVRLIRAELPSFTYSFIDVREFGKILESDVGAGNRIYVQELLFRAHWTGLSAILRNHRWMKGTEAALRFPNYFAFCACLRGLLESAADSHDALYPTMRTLSEHFASFRHGLSGNFSHAMFGSNLENILIHYTHGRRVIKGQAAPPTHHAKTMQDYLTGFEDPGSRKLRDLYAELCEVTHPAALTVHFFADADRDDAKKIEFVDRDDKSIILALLRRHDSAFILLFQKSFNAALLALYVLNRFDDPRFYTPGIDKIDLSYVPAFAEIKEKIVASEKRKRG